MIKANGSSGFVVAGRKCYPLLCLSLLPKMKYFLVTRLTDPLSPFLPGIIKASVPGGR